VSAGGKAQRPPKGEPWIWLTRELVKSAAWRSLGINARRLIDFLVLEHMSHGGAKNGFLLAPRRQLEEAGIAARYISGAIAEADRAGLIDVRRGTGKRPSVYALTWLPLQDGTPATDRWRGEPAGTTYKGKSQARTKGSRDARSDFPREAATPPIEGSQREAPLKKNSYQGNGHIIGSRRRGGEADAGDAAEPADP
jgi:hypothetical protein